MSLLPSLKKTSPRSILWSCQWSHYPQPKLCDRRGQWVMPQTLDEPPLRSSAGFQRIHLYRLDPRQILDVLLVYVFLPRVSAVIYGVEASRRSSKMPPNIRSSCCCPKDAAPSAPRLRKRRRSRPRRSRRETGERHHRRGEKAKEASQDQQQNSCRPRVRHVL